MKRTRFRPCAAGIALLLSGCVLLSGCRKDSGTDSSTDAGSNTAGNAAATDAADALAAITDFSYTNRDQDASVDLASATLVTFNGTDIAISGDGAAADGAVLTITRPGTYVLSGTLDDGQVVIEVDKEQEEKVQLVLSGVSLSCSTSAPIYVKEADKVFLTLAAGTENTVRDGETYVYAEGEDEPNAAIYSADDLTINGTGALTVYGQYYNGISTKNDLVITGGTITVTAVNNGLRGKDCVAILDGTLQITAGNDGIKSNDDTATDKGWVSIDGGSLTIEAGCDGIQAETALQVTGGTISLVTGGGSENASTDASGNPQDGWGQWGGLPGGGQPGGGMFGGGMFGMTLTSSGEATPLAATATATTVTADDADTSDSAKGLKAGGAIVITGGNLTVDASDDAVHSNGTVSITGGTLDLLSGDDGIHADAALTIEGGVIEIGKSFEGLEGLSVTIAGGEITLVASDDGVNAAGGSDGSALGGRPGQNQFATAADGDIYIRITGGTLCVDAGGDGLDSNSTITITGGLVLVNGPTNSADGALDYESSASITGGTLLAVGSAGMAQTIAGSDSQASLMVNYTASQAAGTRVTLCDDTGAVVLSYTPSKTYSSAVFSAACMRVGETYTVYTGGTADSADADGFASGGALSGGTLVTSVTLSSATTTISSNGTAANTGGMGGFGGGGPGGR